MRLETSLGCSVFVFIFGQGGWRVEGRFVDEDDNDGDEDDAKERGGQKFR